MIQGASKEQKKEEGKPIEAEEVEEWEVEKILNKRKIRGVDKYLVQQKGFTAEYNIQKKRENLRNAKETLDKFKRGMNTEVRRQEKLDTVEEKNFRRGELPEKYTTKMLYRWDNRKFKEEYLKKLEKNWQKQKSVSPKEEP